jgi:hypothetical protein
MSTKINTTFQFKKGTAKRWEEVNPILTAGEPGFVIDENRMKIGDGVTAWNDLAYMGENSVVNAETHYDFPSVGRVNVIYKAETEKKIYQWTGSKYEVIGSTEISGDLLGIELINGGGAIIE